MQQTDNPGQAQAALYAAYTLAIWGGRTWEFAVALFLLELVPQSLLLVSAYGLLDNATRFVLSPVVGSYLDRWQ